MSLRIGSRRRWLVGISSVERGISPKSAQTGNIGQIEVLKRFVVGSVQKYVIPVRSYVFLNTPYDKAFENLYLAYIAGLSAFWANPSLDTRNPHQPAPS